MPDSKDRFAQILFYALVFLLGYLAFLVLSPFLSSLAWAAVFAVIFYQMHLRLEPRMGSNGAALVTTLAAAVMIVAPAVMLVSVLAREVPQVIDYVQRASLTAPSALVWVPTVLWLLLSGDIGRGLILILRPSPLSPWSCFLWQMHVAARTNARD